MEESNRADSRNSRKEAAKSTSMKKAEKRALVEIDVFQIAK